MPPTKRMAWGQLPQPSASLAYLSPLLKLVQGHLRLLAENIFLLVSKPKRFNIYYDHTKAESECELEVSVIQVPLLQSWENRTVQISCLRARLHFASSSNKEQIVYHAWKLHKYPSGKRNYSPLKYTFWLEKKRLRTVFWLHQEPLVPVLPLGTRRQAKILPGEQILTRWSDLRTEFSLKPHPYSAVVRQRSR